MSRQVTGCAEDEQKRLQDEQRGYRMNRRGCRMSKESTWDEQKMRAVI